MGDLTRHNPKHMTDRPNSIAKSIGCSSIKVPLFERCLRAKITRRSAAQWFNSYKLVKVGLPLEDLAHTIQRKQF
eukprot:4723000-Amphidinium_carterae.1